MGGHVLPRLGNVGEVAILQRPGTLAQAYDGPVFVGDITEPADLAAIPPMDVIVHMAAEASPQRAAQDPDAARRINVDGTANIAAMALEWGARLVNLSTGQVYGPSRGRPFTETAPLSPQGVYAETKMQAEQAVERARREGLDAVSLRCFNMYGPGQRGPYVVPDIMKSVVRGETPALRDLAPARDFLYITDAVEAIMLAIARPDLPPVVNVAAGKTCTIGEVARVACDLAGLAPPDGPFKNAEKVEVDVGQLRALGWTATVDLPTGLRSTLEWWRQQEPDS